MKNLSDFRKAIDRSLAGLSFISTGACPGCAECGLAPVDCPACDGTGATFDAEGNELDPDCPNCQGEGKLAATERDREYAESSHFSWSACDSCGSTDGGDRHPAHGCDKDGAIMHLDICTDCLFELNGLTEEN